MPSGGTQTWHNGAEERRSGVGESGTRKGRQRPFLYTFQFTFQRPFRDRKGLLVLSCGCKCFSHSDFGVPGRSFARLIQPPARLAVCVTVLEGSLRSRSNPIGRSLQHHGSSHPNEPGLRPSTPSSLAALLASDAPRRSKVAPPCMCFVLWVVCVSPTCFRQRQRSRPRPTEFKVVLRIGGKRFSSRPLENLRAESRSLPVTSGCGRLIDRRLTQEWRRAFLFLSPSLHGSATAKQHDSACQQHAPSASSQVLVPTSTAFWSDQVDHHCPDAIVRSDCGDLSSSRVFKDAWPVRLPSRRLEVVQATLWQVADESRIVLRRTPSWTCLIGRLPAADSARRLTFGVLHPSPTQHDSLQDSKGFDPHTEASGSGLRSSCFMQPFPPECQQAIRRDSGSHRVLWLAHDLDLPRDPPTKGSHSFRARLPASLREHCSLRTFVVHRRRRGRSDHSALALGLLRKRPPRFTPSRGLFSMRLQRRWRSDNWSLAKASAVNSQVGSSERRCLCRSHRKMPCLVRRDELALQQSVARAVESLEECRHQTGTRLRKQRGHL